jgi:hypothetical protein
MNYRLDFNPCEVYVTFVTGNGTFVTANLIEDGCNSVEFSYLAHSRGKLYTRRYSYNVD